MSDTFLLEWSNRLSLLSSPSSSKWVLVEGSCLLALVFQTCVDFATCWWLSCQSPSVCFQICLRLVEALSILWDFQRFYFAFSLEDASLCSFREIRLPLALLSLVRLFRLPFSRCSATFSVLALLFPLLLSVAFCQ